MDNNPGNPDGGGPPKSPSKIFHGFSFEGNYLCALVMRNSNIVVGLGDSSGGAGRKSVAENNRLSMNK